MKILALGPIGTYGHEAAHRALRMLPESARVEVEVQRILLCDSHAEVFQRVVKENCYAVVPIENSIAGLVADTIHGFWLQQKSQPTISVLGEIQLPIEHSLVMRRGKKFNKNSTVLSHPQAISQCRENLQKLGINNTAPTKSTAGAAELIIMKEQYADSAALVSSFAAEKWGLEVLKSHMEDVKGNTTRFHVLGHNEWPVGSEYKTALIFWTKDEPRALANALWAICADGTNMTSIHSLPLGMPGHFAFYVEFGDHQYSIKGIGIMNRLKTVTQRILRLGSFPREQIVIGRG